MAIRAMGSLRQRINQERSQRPSRQVENRSAIYANSALLKLALVKIFNDSFGIYYFKQLCFTVIVKTKKPALVIFQRTETP